MSAGEYVVLAILILLLPLISMYLIHYFIQIINLRLKKKLKEEYKRFEFELKQQRADKIEFYLVKFNGIYQILINNKITSYGILGSSKVVMSFIDEKKEEGLFILVESPLHQKIMAFLGHWKYKVFIDGKLKYTFED